MVKWSKGRARSSASEHVAGEMPSRRDAAQMIALLGLGASGATALTNSTSTAQAHTTTYPSILLSDYISEVSEPSTHAAGFQAAIEAAIAAGGAEIIVPPGEWYADGLEIPAQVPLKIRGHVADNFPNNQATVGGSYGSRIIRRRDMPILSLVGAPSVLPRYDWQGFARSLVIEDVALRSEYQPYSTPMLHARGALGLHFSRVEFFGGSYYGFSLIDFQGVWDSRFDDCFFDGGGSNSTELPAVWLRSGDPDGVNGYNGCNSIVFVNCASSNYQGPGIMLGNNDVPTSSPTNLISFVSHKMDSPACKTSHVILDKVVGVFMSNGWIAHSANAATVLDVRQANGVYGNIAFTFADFPNKVLPSSMIKTSDAAANIYLDVRLMSAPGVDESTNVIDQASESEHIEFNIEGISQRVNGKSPIRWINANTVFQKSDLENENCQYIFAREGKFHWAIGNPSSLDEITQQMEIRVSDNKGNSGTAMIIKSSGVDPATARKEVRIPGGGIVADYAELGGHPVGVRVDVPKSPTDAGEPGMWAADQDWLYLVTQTNNWRRVPLNDW